MDSLKSKEFLSALRKESESEENEEDNWPLGEQTNEKSVPPKTNPQIPSVLTQNINPVGQLKVNNVNNMNINIINPFPQQTDDLIPAMKKLDIKDTSIGTGATSNSNSNKKTNANNKYLALHYYFGERPTGNNPKEEDIFNQDQMSFQNNMFFPQQSMNNRNNNQNNIPPKNFGQNNNDNSEEINYGNFPIQGERQNLPNQFTQPPEKYNVNSQPYFPKNKQFNFEPQVPLGTSIKNSEVDDRLYKLNFAKSGNIPGKFYVIKSVDEANIIRSINFNIWCSTIKGNQKLQKAFKEADKKYPIYLFFSVNGSGKFMGLAQMVSEVEYRVNFNYWSQNDKWKGFFFINWIYIKDIPNRVFRSIINEYNDNKPVTSSRDTQEIFPTAGMEMLKIFKEYSQDTSIFDQMSNEEKMMILQSQQQQQLQNQGQTPMVNGPKIPGMNQGSNLLLMQQLQRQQMRAMNQPSPNPNSIPQIDGSRFKGGFGNMNNSMNGIPLMGGNANLNYGGHNPMYSKDDPMSSKISFMMQQLQKHQQQFQKMSQNSNFPGRSQPMNPMNSLNPMNPINPMNNSKMMNMNINPKVQQKMMQQQSRYINFPQNIPVQQPKQNQMINNPIGLMNNFSQKNQPEEGEDQYNMDNEDENNNVFQENDTNFKEGHHFKGDIETPENMEHVNQNFFNSKSSSESG